MSTHQKEHIQITSIHTTVLPVAWLKKAVTSDVIGYVSSGKVKMEV